MLNIRRSRDRRIFHMGIPIPGKDSLYIKMGPWMPLNCLLSAGENIEEGMSHGIAALPCAAWMLFAESVDSNSHQTTSSALCSTNPLVLVSQ